MEYKDSRHIVPVCVDVISVAILVAADYSRMCVMVCGNSMMRQRDNLISKLLSSFFLFFYHVVNVQALNVYDSLKS